MKRLIVLVTLAATAVLGTGSVLAAPAQTPYRSLASLAGVWHETSSVKCSNSLANARACAALLGSSWVVVGVPETSLSVLTTTDITVDTTGAFLISSTSKATEHALQMPPIACDSQPFFDRGFNGTCTWYSWYHGTSISTRSRMLIFKATTSAYAFQRYVAPQFSPCACRFTVPEPGSYRASRLLAMQGIHLPPSALLGVTARIQVTHAGSLTRESSVPLPPTTKIATAPASADR